MTQPPNNQFPGTPEQPQDPQGQGGFGQQPADPYQAYEQPQAQPGQPGQPGDANQPYGQPPQGVFEQPKKKSGAMGIVRAVIAVVILAVGGFFVWQNFASNAALEPGKCITITGEDNNDLDHTEVNCDDAGQYSYYVAEVFDGQGTCSEGLAYESTSTRRGSSEAKTTKTTCLIPQFAPDTCYKIIDDSIASYEVADCAGAEFKITQVEQTSNASCGASAEPWSFTQPARTYCIELLS